MKRSIVVSWCAGLALGLMAAPLSAQTTVQGAVIVQSGPDAGIANRARRMMGAEVIVVERIRGRYGWWRGSQYRVITVYSDGSRFYRRPFGRTVPALRRVVVYERAGHYYINDTQWKRHRYDHDDRYDSRDGDDDRNDHDGRDGHHDNGNHYGWHKD